MARAIALRNEVDFEAIRKWSAREGHSARFEEFENGLARRSAE